MLWSDAPCTVQMIVYVPALLSVREKRPDFLEPEWNLLGPRVTVTLCKLLPVHFQVTLLPLLTVTVGTPLHRTKQLSPTLTRLVAANAGITAGTSRPATR